MMAAFKTLFAEADIKLSLCKEANIKKEKCISLQMYYQMQTKVIRC